MRLFAGILSFMLLMPSAFAQLEEWTSLEIFSLKGGLNDSAESTVLTPEEASDIQNFILNTSGAIRTRQGFTQTNAASLGSTAVATGLAFYKQSDGDRFIVESVSNGSSDSLQKMDYVGGVPDGVWDEITPSGGLSLQDDQLADFAVVEDVLVFEDGLATTASYEYNGTSVADALDGSPPNATIVEFHKRILWLAGRSDAKNRVDFSNLDEPETYTSTDFLLVETDDGQLITGLKSALDCLYVFKTESIWRICGSDRDNLNLEQMVRGIGAASNQSIALINNKFVFQTSQGNFAIYDGGITVQMISGKIQGTLSNLNSDRVPKTVALAFDDGTGDDDYYACVSQTGSGTHTLVLLFDTFHQAWTKFKGMNCNAMTVAEIGTAQRALLFGDYGGNLLRYPDGETDNGAIIDAFYQSGDLRFPEIPTQKTFRDIQVFMRSQGDGRLAGFRYQIDFGAITVSDEVDLSGTGALWDTAIWDTDTYADNATVIRRIETNKRGDFLQWRLEQKSASNPVLLRGLRIWLEPSGRLGESDTE